MGLINELDFAFNECFDGINNKLILDKSIDKDVFAIQLEAAVDNIRKILNEHINEFYDKQLIKYQEYLSLCELCLFINKANDSIEYILFKEEYLSEEVYRYIIEQLLYVGKRIESLFKYEDSVLIRKYLNCASTKYYNYITITKNKLRNFKIK